MKNVFTSATFKCIECGKLTRDTGRGEGCVQMCATCLTLAELSNAHSDGDHNDHYVDGCPECMAEEADGAEDRALKGDENG